MSRAVVLLSAVQLRTAHAQTAPARARLVVEANPECATRTDLEARVQARSPRVSFVDKDAALVIVAQFSASPSGAIAGEVTLASQEAKPAQRRVLARSCREASDAIALIIAVTLDPASLERSRSIDRIAQVDESPTTPPTPPPPSPKTDRERSDAEPSIVPNDASIARASGGGQPSWGVQLGPQSLAGPAPSLMLGVSLYAQLGLERPGIWSPLGMWGASHVARSDVREAGGMASFRLDAASFDACPLRLRWGRLDARPCGSILAGRLSAQGTQTRNAADVSRRPFWVLGGSAILSTDVFWLLEASLRVSVGVNLVRDSFSFTPDVFHPARASA
jgi:hypothetical protein